MLTYQALLKKWFLFVWISAIYSYLPSATVAVHFSKKRKTAKPILYLLQFIQYQHKQICWLLNFICRYIPLKQWAFDDSHSPKYQKFKIDELPRVFCHYMYFSVQFYHTAQGIQKNLIALFYKKAVMIVDIITAK